MKGLTAVRERGFNTPDAAYTDQAIALTPYHTMTTFDTQEEKAF